jgi:hypothetical protein
MMDNGLPFIANQQAIAAADAFWTLGVERSTSKGMPRAGASSWMPPESLSRM